MPTIISLKTINVKRKKTSMGKFSSNDEFGCGWKQFEEKRFFLLQYFRWGLCLGSKHNSLTKNGVLFFYFIHNEKLSFRLLNEDS